MDMFSRCENLMSFSEEHWAPSHYSMRQSISNSIVQTGFLINLDYLVSNHSLCGTSDLISTSLACNLRYYCPLVSHVCAREIVNIFNDDSEYLFSNKS